MTPQDLCEWAAWLWNLGIGIRLVLIAVAAGYVFRALPFFPNKHLWLLCGTVGAAAFPMMAHPRNGDTVTLFLMRTALLGLFIGMGAATLHDRVLSKNGLGLETKVPVLKNLIEFVDDLGKGRRRNRNKHKYHH